MTKILNKNQPHRKENSSRFSRQTTKCFKHNKNISISPSESQSNRHRHQYASQHDNYSRKQRNDGQFFDAMLSPDGRFFDTATGMHDHSESI